MFIRTKARMVQSASIAALVLLSSAPALAQTAGEKTAEGENNGEIIVTAQRVSQNVLKVPASVSVVGAEALRSNGINDLSAVTKLAPSLQTGNDDSFSVRGIGTNTFAPTVESTVSQVVDEVVLGSPTFAAAAFYDLQRVEVVNGPQGLLFGKNASAGLVNIVTAEPKLGELTGYVDAEGTSRYRPGADGLGVRLRGAVSLPTSEHTALRIAGIFSSQDSLNRNLGKPVGRNEEDLKQYGVRAKFLADSSDGLTLHLGGDYFKSQGLSGFANSTYRSLAAGSQYTALLAGVGVVPGPNNLDIATDGEAFRDLEMGGVQAKAAYTFGSGIEISSITAWKAFDQSFQNDSDQTPANFLNVNLNKTQYNQFSQELRVALPGDGPLTGQAGLYYFQANTKNQVQRGGLQNFPAFLLPNFPFCVGATVLGAPPAACPVSNSYFLGQDSNLSNEVRSYAGFGQVSYAVTDRLKLTAGGRLTYDKASIDLLENVGKYFVTLGIKNNRVRENVENTNFSWKLGIDFQTTPDTLIYGFYGNGYKGPGFSNAAAAPNARLAVRPEISKGGEIGIKSALFDRKLTVSVAAFYTRFNNLQVQAFSDQLQTVLLANAATSTTKGFDLSLQVRPTSGLTLGLAASYTDARFNSYPGAQCYATQTTPSCAVNNTFNASGLRVPLSAKFTSTATIDYVTPITEKFDGAFNFAYFHRSPLTSSFVPGTTVPTWDRIDSNIGVKSESWSLSLFCKNCFNQIRPFSIGNEPGDAINAHVLSYVQRFNYDSVRTIGIRAGVNF